MDKYKEQTQEVMDQGAQQLKKSGEDWLSYIEKHPLQSMLFGIVGYFALKGMMSKN